MWKQKMIKSDIFRKIALGQPQRILGFGDRNENSKTCGCFDRYYWHYALKDFPNARFQESILFMTLLYCNDFQGNVFFGKKKLKVWIERAIKYWISIQNRDGSFNEYYPYESSFVATAFTGYAVSESLKLLDDKNISKFCVDALLKSAKWLAKNNNFDVGNQMAVSISAMYNIYRITGEKYFLGAIKQKINILLKMQKQEGYFLEYGGYDIGYLSIAISYLAKYYRESKDKSILEPLKRAIVFVEDKIDTDGYYDWKLTSRKTQYLYPHGFKIMGSPIVDYLEKGLNENKVLNPGWMDDVFCIPLANDYLQTYLEENR